MLRPPENNRIVERDGMPNSRATAVDGDAAARRLSRPPLWKEKDQETAASVIASLRTSEEILREGHTVVISHARVLLSALLLPVLAVGCRDVGKPSAIEEADRSDALVTLPDRRADVAGMSREELLLAQRTAIETLFAGARSRKDSAMVELIIAPDAHASVIAMPDLPGARAMALLYAARAGLRQMEEREGR